MWRALKGKETFGFRWISFPLADLVILVFGLTACLWTLGHLEFGPVYQPPVNVMGEADKKPWKNIVTVDLSWDEAAQVGTNLVKRNTYSLDELKTWLYPIARNKINKRTKLSEIPVRIQASGDTPFSEVRKILDVCKDRDIQIHKVKLEILDSGSG